MAEKEAVLRELHSHLRSQYPDALEVITNETANLATPLAVTISWRCRGGRKVKSVRAPSLQVDHDVFRRYALRVVEEFYSTYVQGRVLPRKD